MVSKLADPGIANPDAFLSCLVDRDLLKAFCGCGLSDDENFNLLAELSPSAAPARREFFSQRVVAWAASAEEHNKKIGDLLRLSYDDLTAADLEGGDSSSPRGRSVALEMRRTREKTALLHKYGQMFSQDALTLLSSRVHPSITSLDLARMAMAAVVYFSVYNKPPWLCKGQKRIDFCWKVCSNELLCIKKRSMLFIWGQHLLHPGWPKCEERFNT